MKRTLFGLLLVFALAPTSARATDWSDVIKRVEKSVVFIQIGEEGGCTAFIINQEKHYLLTAGHCSPSQGSPGGQSEGLWVDGVSAKTIYLDHKRDLMVIQAENIDPAKPALKLAASNPVRGQEVMSVGYGYALERPFFRQAHIQDDAMKLPNVDGGPFVSTDSSFVGGQSGGPVVNTAGEVVLIVQRGDGGTTGLGVGAETLRQYVGRFFSESK